MTHDPELVTYGPETVGNGNGEAAAPSLIFHTEILNIYSGPSVHHSGLILNNT